MDSLQGLLGVNGASGKPLHLCPNCGSYVIAATWSERASERCVRNVWSCQTCGCEWETAAYFPVKPTAN
jgi:ribosomal protein L37AE/L43A